MGARQAATLKLAAESRRHSPSVSAESNLEQRLKDSESNPILVLAHLLSDGIRPSAVTVPSCAIPYQAPHLSRLHRVERDDFLPDLCDSCVADAARAASPLLLPFRSDRPGSLSRSTIRSDD